MGSIVLSAVLLVGTGWCGDRPLGKTGTSPTKTGCINENPLEIQGVSEAHSFDTEREGFEPTVGTGPTPVFKTGALNRSATSPVCMGIVHDRVGVKRHVFIGRIRLILTDG